MIIWVIGIMFTLPFITDDSAMNWREGLILFLMLVILWPAILGFIVKEHLSTYKDK